ncbi:NUDIX domain-containing protein [Alkalinema pantanalense CENA528]|uniref:NUDIX domain-containing protein n=1 Tax=Alkalinema pantanalense TaxID=1620705 RepID=UPI003D6EB32A
MKQVFFPDRASLRSYLLQVAAADNLGTLATTDRVLNFRHVPIKVGVTGYVLQGDRILLLERSNLVQFSGKWSTVSGYIDNIDWIHDRPQFCRDHLIQEFQEEIGWKLADEMSLRECGTYTIDEPDVKLHLEMFALECDQTVPEIRLNGEHTAYKWHSLNQLAALEPILMPHFIPALQVAGLLRSA